MAEHFEHCYIHEGHLCSCGAAAHYIAGAQQMIEESRESEECLHDWTYMDGARYCPCGAVERADFLAELRDPRGNTPPQYLGGGHRMHPGANS